MDNDVKLGRFISLILRHKPETINIKLDENGWADTKELIEKISKSGREIDFETLERIVNEEVDSLTIDSPISKTVFDKIAISEIKKKSKGGIVLSISPVKKLSKQAKKQIGKRPVLAISLSYLTGKKKITSLGKGKITAFIPYTLNKNEKADGLYAVYVDKKGKVRKIKGSYYDGENSAVVFIAGRLADFGIGYKKESK